MNNTVTINFETEKQAKAFMSWFNNQGEQDYFTAAEMMEDEDKYVTSFSYDKRTNTINGENI